MACSKQLCVSRRVHVATMQPRLLAGVSSSLSKADLHPALEGHVSELRVEMSSVAPAEEDISPHLQRENTELRDQN